LITYPPYDFQHGLVFGMTLVTREGLQVRKVQGAFRGDYIPSEIVLVNLLDGGRQGAPCIFQLGNLPSIDTGFKA